MSRSFPRGHNMDPKYYIMPTLLDMTHFCHHRDLQHLAIDMLEQMELKEYFVQADEAEIDSLKK